MVFDDMIADMESNKKLSPKVTKKSKKINNINFFLTFHKD